MSEPAILWIFGAINSLLLLLAGVGFKAHNEAIQRIVRLEVTLDILGRNAIKLLHSPDDHLSVDRYVDLFIKNEFQLSEEHWQQLFGILNQTINDRSKPKEERTLALLGAAHCVRKLSDFGHKVRLPELQ